MGQEFWGVPTPDWIKKELMLNEERERYKRALEVEQRKRELDTAMPSILVQGGPSAMSESVGQTVQFGPVWQMANDIIDRNPSSIWQGGEDPMQKRLFRVTVVNEYGTIMVDNQGVVAADEEAAKFNAGVYRVLDSRGITPDDVTIFCESVGPVKTHEDDEE